MIEHEPVVSVVHLEQRRAREPVVVAVLHETTASGARATAGIGEAHKRLLRDKRLHPERKALCTGKRTLQFKHGDLFRVGTNETLDAGGDRLCVAPLRSSTSFQSWPESFIAAATCSTVTIDVGERNQLVPRIATTPGCGACSSSKCRVMLTVE